MNSRSSTARYVFFWYIRCAVPIVVCIGQCAAQTTETGLGGSTSGNDIAPFSGEQSDYAGEQRKPSGAIRRLPIPADTSSIDIASRQHQIRGPQKTRRTPQPTGESRDEAATRFRRADLAATGSFDRYRVARLNDHSAKADEEESPATDDKSQLDDGEEQGNRGGDQDCGDINPYVCVKHGEVPYDPTVFGSDPDFSAFDYRPEVEKDIYYGKYLNPTQRPWIEWGRGLYRAGEIPRSETWMGKNNLVAQHFLLYGDYRTGIAYNQNGGNESTTWAHRLNLELDWKITSTERVHAFIGPLDRGTRFTRLQYDNGELDFRDELDYNFDTIFFEGDFGALHGGWAGIDPKFDMPFAVGLLPLFYQNGYWIEDAFVGMAVTIPAKNSVLLDWPNFDVTGFVGFDELNSPAFGNNDSAARLYGTHAAIDAYGGYLEVGYAFLDDRTNAGLSYHNLGVSFTRRYFERVSNSIRFITNMEQDPISGSPTANGHLIVVENSLVSHNPTFFVPYLNLFLGNGSPQSVARAGVAGGILRNVGINFETDGLTGYPLMDDTANDTYGGALGVNILGPELNYQVVLEVAAVQTFGTAVNRRTPGDQYGLGARYQLPLNQAWIWRADAMYAIQEDADDLTGVRTELRYKF